MSAVIHELEHPDDIIEVRTGLPAIDIDPNVVARRMRAKPWKDRTCFLHNVIVGSMEIWSVMNDHIIGGPDEKDDRFNAWCWLSLKANVSAILEEFGSERPECDDSAACFAVALSPAHRTAANQY